MNQGRGDLKQGRAQTTVLPNSMIYDARDLRSERGRELLREAVTPPPSKSSPSRGQGKRTFEREGLMIRYWQFDGTGIHRERDQMKPFREMFSKAFGLWVVGEAVLYGCICVSIG